MVLHGVHYIRMFCKRLRNLDMKSPNVLMSNVPVFSINRPVSSVRKFVHQPAKITITHDHYKVRFIQ